VSERHLLEYFTFQNIFSDGTLFADVQLLPAGCALIVQEDGRTDIERYWDFDFCEPDEPGDPREYAEELDRLFTQAVERQLVSDVPVGAYLSGGMDSGSITAVAAKSLPYLSTFTGGFDLTSASGLELGFDERQKAEAMSYMFRTEQYETVLKAGDMERCLGDLVWHLEDPRVGQSYPNYYIARLASKFVKVALSGTGGDELFAGYPWRYYRAVVNDDFEHYVEKYYGFWHRLVPNATMPTLFRPNIWDEVKGVRTIDIFTSMLPDREPPKSPEDYVNHSLHLEAKTFLHGLLIVEDKLSMAHSLETRVPFLDNDLVDFAERVPVNLKLRDLDHVVKLNENEPGPKTNKYFEQTRDGKLLLRQVMERHVPDVVTRQVKQGFSGPDATWFRGESLDYVRRLIDDDRSLMYEFLEPSTVRALVEQHTSGVQNRRLLLWSLLNFEHWCRTFLAGARP
jgi:asparagine synthase (glutamine-hydrolysing)